MNTRPVHSLSPRGKEIVITGMGAVCSIGNSVAEIWQSLLSGVSGLKPVEGFDASGFGSVAAQVLDPPNTKTDISPQLAKTMGKHLSLLLKSAGEALEHSGLRPGTFSPEDAGFFAGMGMVDYAVDDLLQAVRMSLDAANGLDYDKFFSRGYQEIYPLWPLGMLNNVAFCQAAIHFGLRGENSVFSPHGDAGVMALYEAAQVLREGKAKVVAAGGVSEEISPLSLARARLQGIIGSTGEPGTGSGLDVSFLGECGAMLVLEPLALAESRGARILAAISGFGFSCEKGKKKNSASTRAVLSSMEAALSDAEIGPDDIDLVMLGGCRHGSGLEAVRSVFGAPGHGPVVLSSRGALGEIYAAAPVIDAIIGIQILDSTQIPKGLVVFPRGDNADFLALRLVRPGPARVLIQTASCEGQCASLIVERRATRN